MGTNPLTHPCLRKEIHISKNPSGNAGGFFLVYVYRNFKNFYSPKTTLRTKEHSWI